MTILGPDPDRDGWLTPATLRQGWDLSGTPDCRRHTEVSRKGALSTRHEHCWHGRSRRRRGNKWSTTAPPHKRPAFENRCESSPNARRLHFLGNHFQFGRQFSSQARAHNESSVKTLPCRPAHACTARRNNHLTAPSRSYRCGTWPSPAATPPRQRRMLDRCRYRIQARWQRPGWRPIPHSRRREWRSEENRTP